FEISPVGVADLVQAGPVDDDDRRILPALVRIAHFRAELAASRRWLSLDGLVQRPAQLRRGQLRGRRRISPVDRAHQRADTGALERRNEMEPREAQEMQLAS